MNLIRGLFRMTLGRRLPVVGGAIPCEGIVGRVRIRRDDHGVVSVDAENDEDAWFGLGFCHGQDRAFQLEGLLRVIRGTLAELVGPDALGVDRLSRRIGFRRSARAQLEVLDPDVRRIVDAYAEGVNAGVRLGLDRVPHEFALLRTEPTPWEGADVVGMAKLMSFLLASNWDVELMRLLVLRLDGPEALAALDPTYPDWLPVTDPPAVPAGPVVDRLAEDLRVFTETVGIGGGSNNWAIAGHRTATGRPILANDPHLAPVAPPHWYLARIATPDWVVAGATFVGIPGVPVGFNEHGAWGVTAAMCDNTDLFVEALGPDGRSVRRGDDFVPCEVIVEEISVRGGDPVVEEILVTDRGPIVGPALAGDVGALSMRATWLDPAPIRGLLTIHRSTDFGSFRQEFRNWNVLPLNMVYASVDGHIAWQFVGDAPVRRKGHGTIPFAGWDLEAGWEPGLLSIDHLPRRVDPPEGFIATANNKPVPDGDEWAFLGHDFIDGYRLAAIDEALAARDDWDLDAVARLQLDWRSLPWRELRDVVLAVPADDDDTKMALSLLRAWNGEVAPESSAATVYELTIVELARRVVAAKAPRSAEWALGRGFTPLAPETTIFSRRTGHLVRLVLERPAGWFDRSWEEEIADVLATVVRRLRADHGDDPARWRWGRVRPLTFRHPVGERKPLDRIFDHGPFPWGGDANTIPQAAVSFLDPTTNSPFVPSLRMVVDVGDWDANRFVLPGGQSGNPLSPHYADQLEAWKRGAGISIGFSETAVELATRHVLDLLPL
ncbi:MAG TPA: penicillin acylase family protein [Actinobacteria bacterium]|nr:penicillin acylase family protein [Actinomycetota bacterium]